MAYNFLDIFAGAGGFTLGMEAAGLHSLGAIEMDAVAAATLKTNFGRRPLDFTGPDEGDVRNVSAADLLERMDHHGIGELDLLVATPPCQGFSRVGRGKLDFLARKSGSFATDERNSLYRHAIRLLEALRPKVFLFENVTGILHLRRHNVAEDVCEAVSSVGYTPRCSVLNSAWYGVPQTRERVIIIGVREDLGVVPYFPLKKFLAEPRDIPRGSGAYDHDCWRNREFFIDPGKIGVNFPAERAVSVEEAFDDLPEFTGHLDALREGRKYRSLRACFPPVDYAREPRNQYCATMRNWNPRLRSDQVVDHFCRWTPRDFGTFAVMKPDDRYSDALEVARHRFQEAILSFERGELGRRPSHNDYIPPYPDDSFNEKWRKLIPSRPSWTITAHLSKDTYSHIHFDSAQARMITIREAARIQSFPDAFRLEGNMGDAFRQIGNAVPPLMARALGSAILDILVKAAGSNEVSAKAKTAASA